MYFSYFSLFLIEPICFVVTHLQLSVVLGKNKKQFFLKNFWGQHTGGKELIGVRCKVKVKNWGQRIDLLIMCLVCRMGIRLRSRPGP